MGENATAAAILVQAIFSSDERMQTLLRGQTVPGPGAAADFLKPWYVAALKMVVRARQEERI
jgi:hypothetical protein